MKSGKVKAVKYCAGCKQVLKEDWKFCPYCKTPVKAIICPYCAEEINRDWRYCPFCKHRAEEIGLGRENSNEWLSSILKK